MRITLKMDEPVPANAVYRGTDHMGRAVVEFPDPTPPAPKLIMFVADGEPRCERYNATHWMRTDNGALQPRDTHTNFCEPRQHYRQLPTEQTFSLEDLQNMRYWGHVNGEHSDTFYKLSAIIDAWSAVPQAKEAGQ